MLFRFIFLPGGTRRRKASETRSVSQLHRKASVYWCPLDGFLLKISDSCMVPLRPFAFSNPRYLTYGQNYPRRLRTLPGWGLFFFAGNSGRLEYSTPIWWGAPTKSPTLPLERTQQINGGMQWSWSKWSHALVKAFCDRFWLHCWVPWVSKLDLIRVCFFNEKASLCFKFLRCKAGTKLGSNYRANQYCLHTMYIYIYIGIYLFKYVLIYLSIFIYFHICLV